MADSEDSNVADKKIEADVQEHQVIDKSTHNELGENGSKETVHEESSMQSAVQEGSVKQDDKDDGNGMRTTRTTDMPTNEGDSSGVSKGQIGLSEGEDRKICETIGCGRDSKLQCPTCIKLGIAGSFFCSQECFKGNWNVHKLVHKQAPSQTGDGRKNGVTSADIVYNPYPGYGFTGKLRPYPVTPMRIVPAHIFRPDYADHPEGQAASERAMRGSTNILILNDEDRESLRTACRLGREVLNEAVRVIEVGVTTDEIDRIVHEACIERECYPSPLNYYNFPKSCCTSVNEVICHGIPDGRPLQDGDIVNVDITTCHRGFHGDLNETMFVGTVAEKAKTLVRVSNECLRKAIDIVRPGVKYREVGDIIQKHAQSHGFSVVRSYCGHGIHRLFHTAPSVPHYSKNKAVGIMKAGHSFTIEPMISEGTWKDNTWPDNWTSVTVDGKLSAQFEETLLVTETGCEVLTRRLDRGGQPYFMDN